MGDDMTTTKTGKISSFTDLHAWQEAHQFVTLLYETTNSFPVSEQFGLTNQLRRCGVSVVSNIAEGFSRRTKKDKTYFYTVALGSVTEVQSQLLVARDVGFMEEEEFNKLADKINTTKKLIGGLIKSAETKGDEL